MNPKVLLSFISILPQGLPNPILIFGNGLLSTVKRGIYAMNIIICCIYANLISSSISFHELYNDKVNYYVINSVLFIFKIHLLLKLYVITSKQKYLIESLY